MNDLHGLERFVEAQEPVYTHVRAELEAGRKRTHWMWFVFPQLRGLGASPTSRRFAIASLAEAHAYLEHPLLGPRLLECTRLVNAVEGRTLTEIFGSPDDLKFRSCMTLFAAAGGSERALFDAALRKYCGGVSDERTLALLTSPLI
ncbi:MAG TPA: DUF1810 domain-containing protein [Steroidobacteraceae bacterium]|jgi:uncharacterized protein (DUF1810 family)